MHAILPFQRNSEVGDMAYRILLCGVGGQGTILAAHILADAATHIGWDAKVSEIHGMAQRGGSVTTVVTVGEEVTSMVSGVGEADMIVSFEMLEALRNIDQLKVGGLLIVNDEVIKPASVLTGKACMPPKMKEELLSKGALIVPAQATAKEAGNIKAANIVLLGALSSALDIPAEIWEEVIAQHVPEKTIELNINAFRAGRAFSVEH